MRKKTKDLLVGAALGLLLATVVEVVRHLVEGERSLTDIAWSLWVVPFAAFMWSARQSGEPNVVRGPRDRPLAERREGRSTDAEAEPR
ncbi:hypothetical protein [Nesterenkonia sp. Act20]|uniref:hypothetical protein n=1 Tax=Nesterenkonia sp. Act20 TaxID=1483432 RepID=UPI001C47A8DE|nr:hypothetical protein [Nesterenkonia sp. Act20]